MEPRAIHKNLPDASVKLSIWTNEREKQGACGLCSVFARSYKTSLIYTLLGRVGWSFVDKISLVSEVWQTKNLMDGSSEKD